MKLIPLNKTCRKKQTIFVLKTAAVTAILTMGINLGLKIMSKTATLSKMMHLGGGAEHHDVRLQAHFPGSYGGGSGVVGRKPAKGHHAIAFLLNSICQEELELPYLRIRF